MNTHKIYRFLFYFILHTLIFYLIYNLAYWQFLANFYGKDTYFIFPFIIHLIFCALYFLLTWKDLYSYDYHYFLLSNKIIILKNIMYATLFIPICVMLFFIFWPSLLADQFLEKYIAISLVLLLYNIISFLTINFISSGWISHLVALGYLKKNVLLFSDEDSYPELDILFSTRQTSKNYLGVITAKEGKWYFHDNKHNTKRVSYYQIGDLLCALNVGEALIRRSPSQDLTENIIHHCKKNDIDYSIIESIQQIPKKSFWLGVTSSITVFNNLKTHRDSLMQITLKRVLDLILVSLSLFLFFPISVLVALAIKLEDGGPVFFVSQRVGKNGKLIDFYKFRSMILDADKLKKRLLKYNDRGEGPLFKMKNDPRVTRVGRIIRRYSLDELPQLINVLKGDLSLVGPRPHLLQEVKSYSPHDMLRLECVPGITGLPQIYGRNTIGFKKWVSLDLSYRKNWSFYFDLKILVKSLRIVVAPFFNNE